MQMQKGGKFQKQPPNKLNYLSNRLQKQLKLATICGLIDTHEGLIDTETVTVTCARLAMNAYADTVTGSLIL